MVVDNAGEFCSLLGVKVGVLNVGTGIGLVVEAGGRVEADLLGNAPNDQAESEELRNVDSKFPRRPAPDEVGVEKNFIENSEVGGRGDFEFDRLTDGN